MQEPERYQVYKGRTCLYENEIVITEYLVKNYGLDIGDGVSVRVDDTKKEFIVTGYFVCANDAGKCIGMHYDAYDGMRKKAEILEGEEMQISSNYHYLLSNPELAEEIVEDINSRYEEREAVAKVREGFESMDMIIMAVWALAVLIYLISGIFVAVTVVMICSKIFAREKQDYGIYKAVGFTSKNLRNMFSIRFAIVALIGSVLGVILAFMLSGPVISTLFMSFGLYNYESSLNLISLVIPVIFATFVYYLVAYLVSKKMKKFSPTVLIQE